MAMNENTVRKMVKKLRPSSIALWFSLVISAPVSVSVWESAGNAAWIASASCSSDKLPSPCDDDGVDEAGPADELLRGGEVEQRERRPARRVGRRRSGRCRPG